MTHRTRQGRSAVLRNLRRDHRHGQTEQQSRPRGQSPQGLLSQPRAPAASPGLTVHKVSPTAAEHRHSAARNHLQVSGPGFLSPPDSSFDGHTGRSVRTQGISHLPKGFKIPWEMRGTRGEAGSGRVGVTPESQRPETSWKGRVREVQGRAEEVSVNFRKTWKHVHDLPTE